MKFRSFDRYFDSKSTYWSEDAPRFCDSMRHLTLGYVRDILSAVSDVAEREDARPRYRAAKVRPEETRKRAAEYASPPRAAQAAALVLEAEAGSIATGLFLVENRFEHAVTANLVNSAFKGPDGRSVKPTIVFDPPSVDLQPGGQAIVRIAVTFPMEMTPGFRYSGEISIPEMTGTRIPLVLGCRPQSQPAD